MKTRTIGNNFVDANFFDRTGGPEDTAVDEILRLRSNEEDAFRLLLPYSVKAEIEHPHTPADVKQKAEQFIFTQKVVLTAPVLALHDKVRTLIRGNAQPGQHDKDAFHLVESHRYAGQFFITKDQRLLKKADEIWEMLRLKVVKPSDFLASLKHTRSRRAVRPPW